MAETPGSTLAHYRLLEKLGQGGMGVVWKAHDPRLDRDVAVKVLQPGAVGDSRARERLRREARVLARLSHPGVATVFDFGAEGGVDYLVMEFVPGGTLQQRLADGPLPIPDVLRLGTEIADALEDAHALGFLHRDLKPANIVLTASGRPKMVDFGLARLLQAPATTAGLTGENSIVGSLPYMAPEQVLGAGDDARTDVYALGVLLYEMATGVRPFGKSRVEALLFEILNTAPLPARERRPDLPPALDALIAACMSKDAGARPATAGAVAAALKRIAQDGDAAAPRPVHAVPGVIRSLAVLPLANVSRDPGQEYFTDGMTEALISDLARIKALRVISRTSVMKYKATQRSLPEIARELNVDAILEGSALLVGDRVRINLQLVSARTDETLWAERYDRQLEDVLGLQSDVAGAVAREVAVQVTPREATRLATHNPVNAEAHLEYLKGRHTVSAGSPQAIELSLRHFARALELDPSFAPAWAGVADCHNVRAVRGMAPPAAASDEAAAAARKALALDDSLAEAYAALGTVLCTRLDLRGGIQALERAIERNPGLAHPHHWLGRAYYCLERHPEAQAAMLKALSLDPLSMWIHTTVGDAYYYAREYEKSVIYYRMANELDPRFDGAHTDLARSLEALGRFDEARAQYEKGRELAGGVAGPSFGLAHLEASMGHTAEARRMLAELVDARARRVVSAWGIAALHASLGDVDAAFGWLETAIAERATGVVFLRVHPRLDPIRHDPRYPEMVRRVGLADP